MLSRLYYLERAARVQLKAMATGKPIHIVPEHVCEDWKVGAAGDVPAHKRCQRLVSMYGVASMLVSSACR